MLLRMRWCTRCRVSSFDCFAIIALVLVPGFYAGCRTAELPNFKAAIRKLAIPSTSRPLLHHKTVPSLRQFCTSGIRQLLRSGLADLLLQLLAHVANALVLVRVGRAQRAHVGGDLAHFLPVDAADRQPRLLR